MSRLALVRLMNSGVRVSVAFSARQAIQATDLLVTHSSFMAVEAALLCCPVILVSPEVPSLMPLVTEGLATWASTGQELHTALEDLLGNENSSRSGGAGALSKRTGNDCGDREGSGFDSGAGASQWGGSDSR